MQRVFIKSGHGYENPSPGSGYAPCAAFAGYHVLREPLPTREERVYRSAGASWAVDYGSHSIKLACEVFDGKPRSSPLFLLVEHGGGREVVQLHALTTEGLFLQSLLAMDERSCYAFLYSLYATAKDADSTARAETRREWADAFASGRIRKTRRTKAGTCKVFIQTDEQSQQLAAAHGLGAR